MQRIALFDRARGLAILLMVFANATPILGVNYFGPLWLRTLCSIPAPLFVILAGMMVAKTALFQPPEYYLKRGAELLILAAAINVFIHQTAPFQNIEILYLIGLSIPICYFINYLKMRDIIIFCLVNFIGAQILQFYFPFDLSLIKAYPKWQLWLINGWFPIFPWVGIMCVGLIFYRLYTQNNLFNQFMTGGMAGIFSLGIGLFYFYFNLPIAPFGYQELFYPPSLGFIFICVPVIWLILKLLYQFEKSTSHFFKPLALLGQHSLFNYILHLCIIFWLMGPYFYPLHSVSILFGISVLHTLFLVFLCYFIQTYLSSKQS